jgi:hypothetical protein
MSAAPYAHQWQTNPNILGLNVRPALIRLSPPCSTDTSLPASGLLHAAGVGHRRINLAQNLFIGKVLQIDGAGGALGITETISLTENRINPGFFAFGSIDEIDGTIGASRNTGPTGYAIVLFYLANSSRGYDRIP